MDNILALPTGTELAGDYRIERVLGAGGFGLTYLARETTLDRLVTIKEYFPSDFAAREATRSVRPKSPETEADYRWGLERFIEEAQTLARFDHPNINRVYRYLRANNTAYMVLHFEEGQSLKAWLAGLGRAPRQTELDAIVAPLLDALSLIHEHDFLHRDIAPDNIIIRMDGTPVLIDFGSARGEMVQHSRTVSALVKPGYSPYEQYALSGRQQGPWTDIYSLSATLYQAIAGKRPTDAPTRVLADDYKPAADVALSSYRPQFLAAIDAGLKLRIEERPQSVAVWRRQVLPPSMLTVRAPAVTVKAPLIRKAEPAKGSGAAKGAPKAAPAETGRADRVRRRVVRFLEGIAARAPDGDDRQKPAGPASKAGAAAKAAAPSVEPIATPSPAPLAPKAEPAKPSAEAKAVAPRPVQPGPVKPAGRKVVGPKLAGAKIAGTKAVAPKAADAKAIAPPARPSAKRSWGRRLRAFAIKVAAGIALATVLVSQQERIKAWIGEQLAIAAGSSDPRSAGAARQATARNGQAGQIESRASERVTSATLPRPVVLEPAAPAETVLKGHSGTVRAVAFLADGQRLVSAGADGTLRLWTVKGELIRTLETGESAPQALALADPIAATGHHDGTIQLWNVDQGRRLGSFKRNGALIWSLAFAGGPDQVLAAGHDWAVAQWDMHTLQAPSRLYEGHENAVQAVAHSARAGLVATGGADRLVKVWSAADGSLVRTHRGHRDFIAAIAFSQDGAHIASGGFDKVIKVWSTVDPGSTRTLRGHKGRVLGVAFAPDGVHVASASDDGSVRLWDWRKSRLVRTLSGHTGGTSSVAYAPDGKRLATGGEDGMIRVWETTPPARPGKS